MRIAICGAHGVGKTTISKKLSEEHNLEILPDVVVEAYRMGLGINEGTPIETQTWLIGNQMANEKIKESFVADKCIFDYYVYAKVLGMDDDIVNVAKKVALRVYDYDYIFYIKPEFPIEDDGVRSTDPEFQQNIDETYQNFLDESRIEYNTISGTIDERFQQINNIISK